ncbi:hypothetical protein J6X09_02805 [Candidatus Saccharibacteria bacterium]|nr:hypothetical protein [Candidatus Saccharibacteria bacterium]
MAKKMKKLRNKKPLIAAIVGVIAIAIVGATLAVQGDITRFFNSATLGTSGATFTEQFVSPTNWKPCDTQPKTVTATNNGAQPINVRVTYEDYWINQNGSSLPLVHDGIQVAVINFANQSDWELNENDGWYYYKNPLQPGQTTSSFMASATFNCAYNIGSNELNVCDNNGNCTTPANAYGNANYHINVTIQTTQDGGDWPREDICHSSILYNEIACHTNGPDTNVNFLSASRYSGENGWGINTRARYADNAYPVYYYRGGITNNYVVWAGYCWQILRTTTTGGVKLIYSGEIEGTDGVQTCTLNPDTTNTPANAFSNGFSSIPKTIAETYYMYGSLQERGSYTGTYGATDHEHDINNISQMGTGLSYSNGKYAPTGDIAEVYTGDPTFGHPSEMTDEIRASHRYICADGYVATGVYCEKGAVIIQGSDVFLLYDGELTIQDAYDRMERNDYDSKAKAVLDNWYAEHLTTYSSQLEDTVFRNDRRFSGFLRDVIDSWQNTSVSTRTSFGSTANYANPGEECARKIDSFTVNESAIGNGKLTYPIGLATFEEGLMAGSVYGVVDYDSWITRSGWTYTMSPYYAEDTEDVALFVIGNGNTRPMMREMRPTTGHLLRAVVSLKPGTRFRTGNGTVSKPYIIK